MDVSIYESDEFLELYRKKAEKEHFKSFYFPIIKLIFPVKNKNILDIGCGPGILSYLLAKKGALVTGIDISKEWITYCNKKYNQNNLRFCFGKGEFLGKFKNESFDAVIINMVLLNVPKLEQVRKIFSESKRTLKPNSVFIFSDLNVKGLVTNPIKNRIFSFPSNFAYKTGDNYTASVILHNGEKINFSNKYWLPDYEKLLKETGFVLKKIIGTGTENREYLIYYCESL